LIILTESCQVYFIGFLRVVQYQSTVYIACCWLGPQFTNSDSCPPADQLSILLCVYCSKFSSTWCM